MFFLFGNFLPKNWLINFPRYFKIPYRSLTLSKVSRSSNKIGLPRNRNRSQDQGKRRKKDLMIVSQGQQTGIKRKAKRRRNLRRIEIGRGQRTRGKINKEIESERSPERDPRIDPKKRIKESQSSEKGRNQGRGLRIDLKKRKKIKQNKRSKGTNRDKKM